MEVRHHTDRGNGASRNPGGPLSACLGFALLLTLFAAAPARANAVSLEVSSSRDYRAWSLLGDVTLKEDATYLTLGYTGARPEPGTAASHQLALGVDHALSSRWLVSGMVTLGLPKTSRLTLSPARPLLRLPGLAARAGHDSLGLQLSAGYDSGGFSDVEYGLDLGLGLTRYRLRRALMTVQGGETDSFYSREEPLVLARPSLGGRLMLGTHWELGLRTGLYLYSADPLSAGQFTEAEQQQVLERFTSAAEGRATLQRYLARLARDVGSGLLEANALTGFPSAPARFDVKPSVTYRFNATVRGQLSYGFTRYVTGQGLSHVLATRWTVRLGEPVRMWASLALQSDVPEDAPVARSGLLTVGGEYTF
jgi:hypothetical protein